MALGTRKKANLASSDNDGVAGLPKPARRRKPLLVAAGLLAVLMAAGLVTMFLNIATEETLVWTTAQEVTRGQLITEDDLEPVGVGAATAERLLPATVESQDALVGSIWGADLPAGHLVPPTAVLERIDVPAGQAFIGLVLEPGQMPGIQPQPGDEVMVVAAGGTSQNREPELLVDRAIIQQLSPLVGENDPAGGRANWLVTLQIREQDAVAVRAAAADNAVALIGVPQSPPPPDDGSSEEGDG